MAATIIDGRAVAEQIISDVSSEAAELVRIAAPPKLAAVQVGQDPASAIYTRMQRNRCLKAGITYELVEMPADTSLDDLGKRIEQLNANSSVSALILQMPLPEHLDARHVQQLISPAKDAESVHPANMGRLFFDDYLVAPCTPASAVTLLKTVMDNLAGKEVVIVGHSEIVGKPIAAMLLADRHASPTVTVCHIATKDLLAHTRQAEVLIVAAGATQGRWLRYRQARLAGQNPARPDLRPLIGADHLRSGAVVIDVAVNHVPRGLDESGEPLTDADGKAEMQTVGDVDFEAAKDKAAAITPVPGGVGPVTVAMLLKNTILLAKAALKA